VIPTDQLLADLIPEQREAVTHVDGPLLIVAGAGSGKTRVITRRVAYLVAQGIPANQILAITFTNKAAGEMKSRIGATLNRGLRDWGRLDQPWSIICTFHSLGLRILKHYAPRVGLPENFSIFDSSDQERLIKEAIKSADLSTTNFPAGTVHGKISDAKNKLLTAADYAARAGDYFQKSVARVYTRYQQLLTQNNALDFDDLLMRTAHTFRDHPDVLAELQQRFQYILIDAYQDTNHAQYITAHLLAQKHRNICVVGDPDQSIYAWRGADIQNILDFEKDYADAKVVRLEQNYRSSKTILAVASKLIAHNRQRKEKSLWTENPQGDKVRLYLNGTEHDEAAQVAEQLRRLNADPGIAWSQMAIFYRMNSLSRVMEDALRRAGIPYRIARGVDFYHRKEIKDVLGYLRLIVNPSDEVSLERVVNTPARGISDATVRQLRLHAMGHGLSLWRALETAAGAPNLQARAVTAVKQFVALLGRWRELSVCLTSNQADAPAGAGSAAEIDLDAEDIFANLPDPAAAPAADDSAADVGFDESATPGGGRVGKGPVQTIMEDVVRLSGLEAFYKKAGDEDASEVANINELISSAAEYDAENPEGSLEDYLGRVSLVSDIDTLKESGAITLMTLHAAKGLEFPVVSIIGLEEGILPHSRVREHPEQLEEERRLCFVGITRAQQRLLLSRANYRTIRGLRERTAASRFLGEMPADALEVFDASGEVTSDDRAVQRMQAAQDSARVAGQFYRGQQVKHPTFGLGRIAEIADAGQHTRAVVEFARHGRKTLILQYARLEPVG